MEARRSSSLALSGELSLSFRDELAATIHGAFEVAVEIAVLEISKLVSQALGDVRDQMQETLRENQFLKSRLQSAEQELDTARRGPPAAATERPQAGQSEDGGGFTQPQKGQSEQQQLEPRTPEQTTEESYQCAEGGSEQMDSESFREIREDGRVRSHDLNPAPKTAPVQFLDPGPQHDSCESEKLQKAEHSPDIPGEQNQSPVLLKEEPLHLKEESLQPELEDGPGGDGDLGSGCSFIPNSDEEFRPDKLSLVQSKLLEDWRPDPEQSQKEKMESVDPGPSQSHEVADVIPSAGGRPAFSASFDGLFPATDRPHLVQAAPQNYGVRVRTNAHPSLHLCKLCGHSFNRASDLRRHHSQQHRSNAAKASSSGRPAKKQLFPPGCSPYHCNECGRDFNRMENLKTHLRIHTGERPYACSVCGVRFRHSGALTRHFRIHTGEKPYVCGQCGKRFRNCGGLRFHQKSHSRDRHIFMN
ncbi:zinc finger protein 184 [Astyanax mexicanus]|uniref:Zinc finger protein 184-like n=1 Tax=Astyanax mexicanus TaxID=7994 RepID=A0A8T2LR92_ASTMX|nr:zinc finger protein 184 [Astyanax mexicanus]KAG9274169.1 zinc finger protein 184-like [Astyanax mexicanus]